MSLKKEFPGKENSTSEILKDIFNLVLKFNRYFVIQDTKKNVK
jgi:hypothetical protein